MTDWDIDPNPDSGDRDYNNQLGCVSRDNDSGSHKVQHYLHVISHNIKNISRTIRCTPENSSDLERAPGARSIGDEFSGVHIIVQHLEKCENTAFHIHAAPFGTRSPI